ncbi:monovalent cation/H+ antiporter complex subunit F [Thermococcus sp.]|uniref:monovalent cation/H+ antiporter complex subunit F n=1 Tax=Thermococcus sp. TaxID=35749 RepID=UPI002636C229|nr:monovalent cation/H+ antiporter complex subunit F [Thermococcus sp.]
MQFGILTVVEIAFPLYLAAFVIYALRAVRGPTVPDMILAVDCMSFDIAAFMAILALYFRSTYLIGGAVTLALWAYLLDLYVANHLARGEVGA